MVGRLAPITLAALLVVAGCAGPGNRTPVAIQGSAAKATVAGDALGAAGYEEVAVTPGTLNTSGTLSIAGDVQMDLSYRVRAETWRAAYARSADAGPAVFALLSVPLVKPENVAATINPLRTVSTAATVERAQDRYAVEGLTHERNRSTTLLGTDVAVRQYAGEGTVEGSTTEVVVFVASVRHDGDVVTAVAVAPAGAADWATVRDLLSAVDH